MVPAAPKKAVRKEVHSTPLHGRAIDFGYDDAASVTSSQAAVDEDWYPDLARLKQCMERLEAISMDSIHQSREARRQYRAALHDCATVHHEVIGTIGYFQHTLDEIGLGYPTDSPEITELRMGIKDRRDALQHLAVHVIQTCSEALNSKLNEEEDPWTLVEANSHCISIVNAIHTLDHQEYEY